MIRRRRAELMDDPAIEPAAHAHALRSLNRINRWLAVDRCLTRKIRNTGLAGPVSVLELGAGGGGFVEYCSRRLDNGGLRIGLDRSALAMTCARGWHSGDFEWIVADARHLPLSDDSVDVVTCSLLLHHFDPPDAVTLLREAARVARRGMVVGDLSRSWAAWLLTWLGTRVLSRSRIVHLDGPRSVRAAFSKDELADLARQAGLHNARIEHRFPFRLLLTWIKNGTR